MLWTGTVSRVTKTNGRSASLAVGNGAKLSRNLKPLLFPHLMKPKEAEHDQILAVFGPHMHLL